MKVNPRRKFVNKKPIGKKVKQRKAFGNSKLNVPKNMVNLGLGFPKKTTAKLRYTDIVVLTSTTGAVNKYLFSLNSLHDPNITATGTTPLYYTQLMALYNHYTVIGCKISVEFFPYEGNTIPTLVILYQDDDSTSTPTTLSALCEQSGAKSVMIGSDGGSSKTLTLGWSAKKTFGGSVLGNDNLQGSLGASPVEQSTAVLCVCAADQITTVSCAAKINIEYVAVFEELKNFNSS